MRFKKALSLAMVIYALIFGVRAASAAQEKDFDAFFQLCQTGSIEEIRAAIEAGADVAAQNSYGITALYSASENKDPKVFPLLIEKGADVNVKHKGGGSVLMYVTARAPDPLPIMRLLIDKGADVNLQNNDGETALMLAIKRIQFGELGITEGRVYDPLPIMRLLIDKGADVNAKDNLGTILMYAIAIAPDPLPIMRLLVDKGADLNAQVEDGKTALMLAIERPQFRNSENVESIISFLLDSGADPDLKNKKGLTALDMAVATGAYKDTEILKRLEKVTSVKSK